MDRHKNQTDKERLRDIKNEKTKEKDKQPERDCDTKKGTFYKRRSKYCIYTGRDRETKTKNDIQR